MLKAYINYPNPNVTIHAHSDCASVQQQHKKNQRVVRIEVFNLSGELTKFRTKEYVFRAQAETNDMWLDVDFGDAGFEKAVVEYIRRLLGSHYTPFVRSKVDVHC
jgi:hypothetical protein